MKPSEGWRTYLLIALLILAGGVLVSYLIALDVGRRNQAQNESRIEGAATYFEQVLNRRMDSYEEVLRAGANLFRIAGDVTRVDWEEFVDGFDMARRYPGTRAFGYAEYVTAAELDEHLSSLAARGVDKYELTPPGARPVYAPVIYAQLAGPISAQATFGFDIFSDNERRNAAEQAIDLADVVVTNPIVLKGDQVNRPNSLGLALYFPHYAGGQAPSTTKARQAAIAGFTLATLNVEDLIVGLFGAEALANENSGVQISAIVDEQTTTQLYASPSFERVAGQADATLKTLPLTIHNKNWQAVIALGPDATGSSAGVNPRLVFTVGVLVSLILASTLFGLMVNRLFKTTVKQEEGIQQAKEELLSLTSHQLRTPATGVKQYLGILLQGYSGELSREQKTMLKKAYEANERQLDIINQLLYVAKADIGQIRLEKKRHDLTQLVRDVLDNYRNMATAKKLSLNFRRTVPLWLKADARYVRMIIENLISNAIKYSHPNGTISLNLKTEGKLAVVQIKDQGVGIQPEYHDQLFKKFSRIDNELSHQADGSGVGLYLAQKLAEAHGGQIKVSSVVGVGTSFSLEIPGAMPASKKSRTGKPARRSKKA